MTTEEKARAYDEALKRFKSFKEKYYTRNTYSDVFFDKTGNMPKDFEEIFPELRESEDERIRKELIVELKSWEGIPESKRRDYLAYLEKQKELKIPEEKIKHPLYVEGFEAGKQVGAQYVSVFGKQEPFMSREELLHLLLQNGSITLSNYLYLTGKQKPAELSEEDKEMILKISTFIKTKLSIRDENDSIYIGSDMVRWIKSLPERLNLQPKQGWSGEDGRIIDTIVSVLSQYMDYKAVSDTGSGSAFATPRYSKEIDWLKSLRPSWKPSEEHLSALLAVFNDPNNIDSQTCQLALSNLYEQLKKL